MEQLLLPPRTVDVEEREENEKKILRNNIIMTLICVAVFVVLVIYCFWFQHQAQQANSTASHRRLLRH